MKRFIIIVLLSLLVWLSYAAVISQSEAQAIGISAFTHLNGSQAAFVSSEAYFGSYAKEAADFYILRFEPAGFILMAAEDRCIPVLGYSLESEFPHGDIPAHIAWYLDQYSRGLTEIRQNPEWQIDESWDALRAGDYSEYSYSRNVAPLLSTTWDQDYPYNYACPADASGPGGRVYAGCVATAMAQVMKKWNHPATGVGSHSYTASGYGNQSANFGSTTYNWAGMPNSISTVNNNVATLIYHCGVAVNMQYSPNGSAAYSEHARTALVNYFRYHNSAQYLSASSYPIANWATMLRNDLDLGRPIYYGGQGPESGHAFVLDGYQGTNSFHFNWGWSGYFNGYFYLTNLNPGSQNFTQSQAAILNVYPLGQGSLTGTVSSSGIVLAGANVSVDGTAYSTSTNASGGYTLNGIASGNFQVTASKTGYESASHPVNIAVNETSTQNFVLAEIILPPSGIFAELAGNSVNLSWFEPGSGGVMAESFEDDSFPPEDWTQVISNSGNEQTMGVYPTWCRIGTVAISPEAAPQEGEFQSGLFWSQNHQDEWLKSPVFHCPPSASLSFWSYVFLGSSFGDHYYVKVSTDMGNTWTQLWDASAETGGWNCYTSLIEIDLAAYSGQEIMLAWHAQDPPSNDGIWFYWFIDDIHVHTSTRSISFDNDSITRYNPQGGAKAQDVSMPIGPAVAKNPGIQEAALSPARILTGYKVWRLSPGQESNEAQWNTLTPSLISSTTFQDGGWNALPGGSYKWAVKAVYTSNAMSAPIFSNTLVKEVQTGNILGFVSRQEDSQGIAGALVSAGDGLTTTTNGAGAYVLNVPSGIYSVSVSATGYNTLTQEDITVSPNQNTIAHFFMTSTSQNITLTGGWNLISLNFSPADHTLNTVLAPIFGLVQQVKGSEGVFVPGNPYSTFNTLTDGKAYYIKLSSNATWNISGTPIPVNTSLALNEGWNMTAYLPQNSMAVTTAMQSISNWLQQVKGSDGVYIPDSPYSTLSTMYPGKGYWVKLTGAHSLIYPTGRGAETEPLPSKPRVEVTKLPSSLALLARCDCANPGDLLLAKVNGELRGAQELIAPEGFPAALLQIYSETANEEISLWLLSADGTQTELANRFNSQPNATLGSYPDFVLLEPKDGNEDGTAAPTQLHGCYPNPFNPSTTISFSIAEDGTPVVINIYNMRGQLVSKLIEDEYQRGAHQIIFSGIDQQGSTLSSGIYIIELRAGSYRKTAKAILAK
ncbi:MAG: C10 family peptidase [Candidatus Cloacimonetes bacterium]|nr:C10 family peptidase [Candidatus Cloacimonadota bacterium]MCK9184610.1 C10 family peptidase [Candidatus Cloacimonadota bacterium]